MQSDLGLVSEAAVSYTSGADMTLTANQYTASNVVTPANGVRMLRFTIRLASAAIMYLRSGSANGSVQNGASIPADTWYSWEQPWDSTAFSIRFSVSQTVRNVIINGGY